MLSPRPRRNRCVKLLLLERHHLLSERWQVFLELEQVLLASRSLATLAVYFWRQAVAAPTFPPRCCMACIRTPTLLFVSSRTAPWWAGAPRLPPAAIRPETTPILEDKRDGLVQLGLPNSRGEPHVDELGPEIAAALAGPGIP